MIYFNRLFNLSSSPSQPTAYSLQPTALSLLLSSSKCKIIDKINGK